MIDDAILIGQTGVTGIRCLDWFDPNMPNVADYETVFVNEVTLVELFRNRPFRSGWPPADLARFHDCLCWLRERLRKLLKSNGRIYAIFDEYRSSAAPPFTLDAPS